MRWFFRARRSDGVRVGRRAFQDILRGNTARKRKDWSLAATCYRRALQREPALAHIHVQLGHALKEAHRADEARTAYLAAAALLPGRREPLLYLADLARQLGHYDEAVRHYSAMLAIEIDDEEAAGELSKTLRYLGWSERQAVVGGLQHHLPNMLRTGSPSETDDAVALTVVFDVSDLVNFFSHAHRPTGIQRVQVETVAAAIERRIVGVRVVICCMSESSDCWQELPMALFRSLVHLGGSGTGNDTDWRRLRSLMRLTLLLAPPFSFTNRTTLVNLGASWWLGNYFLVLRDVQARHSVAYLPFVHDLIPVFHPECHTDQLTSDFINWLVPAFDHAQAFLTNSKATRIDLERALALTGWDANARTVTVVPLNATFGSASRIDAEVTIPAEIHEPFVLFVGTIEPRKGHASALDAWKILIRRGIAPLLVCVGRNGWNNQDIYTRLEDPELSRRVLILSDIDDVTLGGLYDQSLFTLYPSRYEGWGLPVTEALCRGKVVVTTTVSSLPEAGEDFAVYVPADDPPALAAAVAELLDHPDRLRRLETRIVEQFRPRSWADVAGQVINQAVALCQQGSLTVSQSPAKAVAGRFHRLATLNSLQLHPGICAGEMFRADLGWHWPEKWGCRVRDAGGGALAFSTDADRLPTAAEVHVLLLLRGVAAGPCHWLVRTEAGDQQEGMLAPFERRWVQVATRTDSQGSLHLSACGALGRAGDAATADRRDDPDFLGSTLGIEGFFFVFADQSYQIEALKDAIWRASRAVLAPAAGCDHDG